jgi:small subunit ribosomal protein S13
MRILGITIPEEKQLKYGLPIIFGIGQARAVKILEEAGVDPVKKPKDLSSDDENKIRELVEEYTLEGDLRREVSQNVKRLKDIQNYKGTRHSRRLPVRGQRTKTNSRTVRGNKRQTMASGKRKLEKT